jgi:methionine aminotransferase
MAGTVEIASKLPDVGVSIFSVMTRLASEQGAINLSQGFPDFDCEPALVEAMAAASRAGHNQYAPMPGVLALREGIAAKVEHCYGARYDAATEVLVTSGATAGLYATLTAFVRPGDEVVLFEPCYDSYVPVIRLSGGTPVFVSLRYPDYAIDWDEVRRAITPLTRAILVNTPHNPTGMMWSKDDMRHLAALVDGTDILLIGDEVYEHIVFDGRRHESLLRYPDLRSRAVVISSFGKTFHTTGWKVGYCLAPQPLLAEVTRVHQFVTFTVHTPSQMAFSEFVRRDPAASALSGFYQQKRDLFLRLIAGSRFRPLSCAGTYFQLLDYSAISKDAAREVAHWLITEHGVASIPVSAFLYRDPGGPVLRFCFAKKDETLQAAAERLAKV